MIRRMRLEDAPGRDGLVYLAPPPRLAGPDFRAPDNGAARFTRLIKNPIDRGETALRRRYTDNDAMARALIDADPEIDMACAGRVAGPCDRVWVDRAGAPLYAATVLEVVYGPDGVEKERRTPVDVAANIGEDMPLRWTDRFFTREEVIRRFTITRKYQVAHTDSLTFDFLLRMAFLLEKKDALVSIGAGPKGRDPLVFERNGTPHRAFLEGRTNRGKYLLVLHLSDLELKRPHP